MGGLHDPRILHDVCVDVVVAIKIFAASCEECRIEPTVDY